MASCLTNDFIDKLIKSKAVALDADIDASTDTAQPAGATTDRIYCFATGSTAIGQNNQPPSTRQTEFCVLKF